MAQEKMNPLLRSSVLLSLVLFVFSLVFAYFFAQNAVMNFQQSMVRADTLVELFLRDINFQRNDIAALHQSYGVSESNMADFISQLALTDTEVLEVVSVVSDYVDTGNNSVRHTLALVDVMSPVTCTYTVGEDGNGATGGCTSGSDVRAVRRYLITANIVARDSDISNLQASQIFAPAR